MHCRTVFRLVRVLIVVFSLMEYGNGMGELPRLPPGPPPSQPLRPPRLPRKLRSLGASISTSGPVQLRLNSSGFAGDNLKLKCVANVTYQVQFQWHFNDMLLNESKRIKIQSSSHESILTVRKAQRPDSGLYSCSARFNGKVKNPKLFVPVKPRPTVMIKPRSAIIERGKTMVLHCENLEGNETSGNITWYQKRLPDGKKQRVRSNNPKFEWTPRPRDVYHSKYDVYDVFCEIRTSSQSTRSPIAKITVIKPGSLSTLGSCPAEVAEGIQWQKTISGMVDIQPCYNNTGEARRRCAHSPGRPPRWRRPNLRHCSSPLFKSIEDEIAALDEGFKVDLDIPKILRELSGLTRIHHRPREKSTRSPRLFGKDLLSTVSILRRARDFFKGSKNPRKLAKESFAPFTETASNLLDLENQATWEDIDEENPDTPAELVTALDDFGFDFESNLNEDGNDVEEATEENLAFQVRHIPARSELRRSGLTFRQNDSLIHLPPSIFDEGSSQAVTVVNVVYNTLSSILANLNVTRGMYIKQGQGNSSGNLTLLNNSKIISSSVKPLSAETFKQPVKIILENNATTIAGSIEKRCVFWEPEKEDSKWSDRGCRIVAKETNDRITTCECDHLTLFAVMVDMNGGSTDSSESSKLEIISTVGSAISLAAVILTILIYVCLWKTLKSPRFVNLMNLCVAIGLLDIFSVIRGPFKEDEDVCRAIGILLHYFLLALFLWMLCEGILLYFMLAKIFSKDYGKKWYTFVHLLGWGLPALIVAISVGVAGPSQYGRSGNCWLTRSNGFVWAALGPMITVLLINYVVYGIMLYRVLTSYKVQQEDAVGKFKASFRASIVILPVLGFTWMFAVLDFFMDEVAFKYLFAIFNSLQGLFIFLFHCLLNSQVQQTLFRSKKPENKRILDRVKTQEMQMKSSQDSLNKIVK